MYLLIRFFIGMFPGLKSYLHPTMYLLILISSVSVYIPSVHLHPTMYLLIRSAFISKVISCNHLHPTMYLLILRKFLKLNTHINNLHPTMYLLILITADTNNKLGIFTSHYVSINSQHQIQSLIACKNLHPTMYLLIQ